MSIKATFKLKKMEQTRREVYHAMRGMLLLLNTFLLFLSSLILRHPLNLSLSWMIPTSILLLPCTDQMREGSSHPTNGVLNWKSRSKQEKGERLWFMAKFTLWQELQPRIATLSSLILKIGASSSWATSAARRDNYSRMALLHNLHCLLTYGHTNSQHSVNDFSSVVNKLRVKKYKRRFQNTWICGRIILLVMSGLKTRVKIEASLFR